MEGIHPKSKRNGARSDLEVAYHFFCEKVTDLSGGYATIKIKILEPKNIQSHSEHRNCLLFF